MTIIEIIYLAHLRCYLDCDLIGLHLVLGCLDLPYIVLQGVDTDFAAGLTLVVIDIAQEETI